MKTKNLVVLLGLVLALGSCTKPNSLSPSASPVSLPTAAIEGIKKTTVSGQTVTIRATVYKDRTGKVQKEYQIPKDTTDLRIGDFQTIITNIEGIGQLDQVKRLVLFLINTNRGSPSELPTELRSLKNVELLCFNGCDLGVNDLEFMKTYSNLKTLIFGGGRLSKFDSFDLSGFGQLSAVWLDETMFEKQFAYKKGTIEPSKEPYYFQWQFPTGLRNLYLASNQYPLTFTDAFLSKLGSADHIFIGKLSFGAGKNTIDLSKYRNVKLVADVAETKKYLSAGTFADDLTADWQTWPAIK